MQIDIHTLAVALGVANLAQVVALYLQYRLDRTHSGIGWWVLGSVSFTLGFACNYLRDFPVVGQMAIVGNTALFVGGIILLYVGTLRFLGQRERWRWLAGYWGAILALQIYFLYVQDSLRARRVLYSFGVAVISLLIARAMRIYRTPRTGGASAFLMWVFLVEGVYFAQTSVRALTIPVHAQLFATTASQAATYLIALITGMLWTFGFILLVNQQLAAERQQTIEELMIAAEQIKTLRGIVPICSGCKKIRDDRGYWEQLDAFVTRHTEAEFSHGICPDCMQRLYPGYAVDGGLAGE